MQIDKTLTMISLARFWLCLLSALIPTRSSVAFASNRFVSNRLVGRVPNGGSQTMQLNRSAERDEDGTFTGSSLYCSATVSMPGSSIVDGSVDVSQERYWKIHSVESHS